MAADSGQQSPVNLPPGFQLDNPQTQPQQQQSAPPSQSSLPPGFVLDQPQSQGVKPDGGVLGQAALGALAGSVPNEPTLAQLQKYAQQIGVPVERAPELAGAYKDAVAKQQEAQNQPAEYTKQNIAENIGEGALKGTGQTVSGLAGIAEKIPGVGDIPLVKHLAEESKTGDYQTHGIAQATGNIAENILEFFGGDEALKALGVADRFAHAAKFAKFLEESPRAAKAFEIGMAALRQGTVAGAQTIAKGGTGKEAAGTGAITAGVAGIFGGLGIAGDALYDAVASRQPEAIAKAYADAASQGHQLADEIAGKTLGGQKASALEVEDLLNKAEDQMHSEYQHGLVNLSQEAGAISIPTGGTDLQDLTKEMTEVGDLTPKQETALQINKIATGGDFTWDEMIGLRKNISAMARRLPYDSPLLRDLSAMRAEVDKTTQSALDMSGKSDLAKTFSDMRTTYWEKSNAFRNRTVRALTGQDPDSLATTLLSGNSKISALNQLQKLIGTDAMQPVEGALLQHIVDVSSKGTEGFNPRTFIRQFNNLNPEVRQTIWGKNLPAVEQLFQTVKNLPLDTGKWGALAGYMEHRAVFDIALRGAGLGALAGGLVGAEKSSSSTGIELGQTAAILGALLLFHSPRLLKTANAILQGTAKAAPAVTSGVAQEINKSEPKNKTENLPSENPESENMLTKPENHVHIRNSEGNEFMIPKNQMDRARQIDPGLQLLKESGQENA